MWYMPQINLRVSDETLDAIDKKRGHVPRNRWLNVVIARALDPASATAPAPAPVGKTARRKHRFVGGPNDTICRSCSARRDDPMHDDDRPF